MSDSPPPALWNRIPALWPGGWWDQNKGQVATLAFNSLQCVDPQAQQAFPEIENKLQLQFQRAKARWTAVAPWNLFSALMTPSTGALHQFAQGQVWVDETRIACALERYRLAHGVYPDSLDALAPAYIDALPHDIMTGAPYHYQLRSDGTFLLYSVGWNQIDDGGKVVYEKENPERLDYQQGDWVWPTPK